MEKKHNVAIILNIVIVSAGLICQIAAVTRTSEIAVPVLGTAMYLLICFYAIWGYRKPHGNLLRYLMLVFDATLLIALYFCLSYYNEITIAVNAFTIALVAYMAGRLNKVKQNIIIVIFVLLLFCYSSNAMLIYTKEQMGSSITIVDKISMYAPVLMWLSLSLAYFTRYLQHKEAGSDLIF